MDEKILKEVFDKYATNGKLDPTGLFGLLKKLGHITQHKKDEIVSPSSREVKKLKEEDDSSKELVGINMEEVLPAFAFIDFNGNGYISYEEFRIWWKTPNRYDLFVGPKSILLRKAYTIYKKYDKGCGLTKESFGKLLKNMNIENDEEDQSFSALDENKDGYISFREFIVWLKWI